MATGKSHARTLRARARQKTGARVERANVRCANRCGRGRSTRPHHCATFAKRYTMMRSNRPSATATAR
eukprot:10009773-Lingulodinium_polyedra.AAC.1